ncbi:MAG: hypothetical protein NVS2B7_32000 [Herpetosiphon sp.]
MEQTTLFAHAVGQAQDAVLITDAELDAPGPHILYANAAFLRMTGYNEGELLGRSPRMLQGPNTARVTLDEFRRCLAAGQHFTGSLVNYRKDGTLFEMEWHVSPVYDTEGRLTQFLSIQRDISDQKRFAQEIDHYIKRLIDEQAEQIERQHALEQANERLRALATTDGLTGLYNHRFFHETLSRMLANDQVVSLLLLDVDYFKAYNDRFGHPSGDILLQSLARVLQSSIRAGECAARYGGEEFAVLLPGQDADHAIAVAERMRAAVEAIAIDGHIVTISVGIATAEARQRSAQGLLAEADAALYAAKAQGRNRLRHHQELQRLRAATPECHEQCAPSPTGCLRCQTLVGGRQGRTALPGSALLLGTQDHDADATLRRALHSTGFAFTEIGPVLVIPDVRRRLGDMGRLLKERLSPYTRSCIRATYSPGGAETLEQALAAFLHAEPLTKMLEHVEHEWVRDALTDDWLFSVFHPIVDAHTGAVFAQEALLRARQPDDDHIIGADPIIQACDVLNLQHQLDQRARKVAIRDGSRHVPAPTRLFINFLPNTIYDPEICLRTTMEAANEYNVPLAQLVFEVVETEQIPDLDHLRHILDYYRERGVGTAVDDMGAGFTSIEYISALRPDYVKLDRQLVVEAERSVSTRQQLAFLVNAAHDLGCKVIAEGIETEAQYHLCLNADVDYLQGFLFAMPASPPQQVRLPVDRLVLA